MKALTIRQPWADAIAHGPKRVENRSWPVPDKHIGTRILIHAGSTPDRSAELPDGIDLSSLYGGVPGDQRGAIIAIATLTSCHFDEECCKPWGMTGYFHWELDNVTTFAVPIPSKGALGFWSPNLNLLSLAGMQKGASQ
ncbi:ASCH domain-containing protein [Streptomyces sp. NPDC004728]|uniref:ASCH domain-containing protein n=1 Tax=Streptomyces sp. NPDC004728 TaxID=3154289 RepID=UPI0033B0F433